MSSPRHDKDLKMQYAISYQVSTAFRGFGNFHTNIARVLSPMRPYQALTNNGPKKGPLQDIKNFRFLSSPPSPGLLLSSFFPTYLPQAEFWRRVPETPWPQGMVYFYFPQRLSRQQLDGRRHLHDNDNDNLAVFFIDGFFVKAI